jgi:metallo-beta-lactamase family protein
MAIESSKVYEKFVKQLNKEARDFYDINDELFDFDNFEFVPDLKKSKALSNHYEPCIIISSSGMISGGRVENHVKENLENSKSTICIVGFCAEGSIGHELMNGATEVMVKNKMLEVRCHIEVLDCFSAHGDQNDLVHFVKSQEPAKLKKIFLTHGELKSMEAFKEKLDALNYKEILFPVKGEVFEL